MRGSRSLCRLRPAQSWDEVTEAVNAVLLGRAPRRLTRNAKTWRAMELAASFLRGRPRASLAEIGTELSRMGVVPRSEGRQPDPITFMHT